MSLTRTHSPLLLVVFADLLQVELLDGIELGEDDTRRTNVAHESHIERLSRANQSSRNLGKHTVELGKIQ